MKTTSIKTQLYCTNINIFHDTIPNFLLYHVSGDGSYFTDAENLKQLEQLSIDYTDSEMEKFPTIEEIQSRLNERKEYLNQYQDINDNDYVITVDEYNEIKEKTYREILSFYQRFWQDDPRTDS